MIRFKVVDNRTQFAQKLKKIEEYLDSFYLNFLYEIADRAVNLSPVDTGNYITSFTITSGRPTGETSSEGKPRNQDYNQMADIARANLYQDIAALPSVEVASKVYLVNRAWYAYIIEQQGDAPFAHISRERNNIAKDAAQRSL